jgi:hypothetical protein
MLVSVVDPKSHLSMHEAGKLGIVVRPGGTSEAAEFVADITNTEECYHAGLLHGVTILSKAIFLLEHRANVDVFVFVQFGRCSAVTRLKKLADASWEPLTFHTNRLNKAKQYCLCINHSQLYYITRLHH